MTDIMEKLKEVGEIFKQQNYTQALESLDSLWSSIPEPKYESQNSFLIILYGAKISPISNDLEKAWDWATLAPKYNKGRQDIGEAEFLVGKIAFERGDLDIAYENLQIANKKSRGFAFEGEDPKYKALIK